MAPEVCFDEIGEEKSSIKWPREMNGSKMFASLDDGQPLVAVNDPCVVVERSDRGSQLRTFVNEQSMENCVTLERQADLLTKGPMSRRGQVKRAFARTYFTGRDRPRRRHCERVQA